MKRLSPGIQKLVDAAERAEKSKRARARPAASVARLPSATRRGSLRVPSLPADHPFNRPRRKKKTTKKTARKTTKRKATKRKATKRKLRCPTLPASHPFNRSKRKKAAKKTARKTTKRKTSKRKASKRKRSAHRPQRMASRAAHARTAKRGRSEAIRSAAAEEREARLDLFEAERVDPEAFDAAEQRYAQALARQNAAIDYPRRERAPRLSRSRPSSKGFGLARAKGFRRVR